VVVDIDKNSGFCFGVEFAIQMAEDEMEESGSLYCLGDIVHNDMEVRRLNTLGLKVISRDDLLELKDSKVLIRAHGEPPETYKIAMQNNLELIDASCPVVLKLQNRVKNAYDKSTQVEGQLVIYGKQGHAEVIGLTGQTKQDAIVVMNEEDLDQIDFKRPITLFSQTTKSTKGFYDLKLKLENRIAEAGGDPEDLNSNDSICRQVSNRAPQLVKFAQSHDVILFISSKKSSNGKALYGVCLEENARSYFIENEDEIQEAWFEGVETVGICGATSTPMWLMESVANQIKNFQPHKVE
jgi:4-hydroxy-3-methylbut-2-enyl diphosphate reductase